MHQRYIHHLKHFRECLHSGDTICLRIPGLVLSQSFQGLCEAAVGCFCPKAWNGYLFANEEAVKEVGVSKEDQL